MNPNAPAHPRPGGTARVGCPVVVRRGCGGLARPGEAGIRYERHRIGKRPG